MEVQLFLSIGRILSWEMHQCQVREENAAYWRFGEFLGTIASELVPLLTTLRQITKDMRNAMIRIVELVSLYLYEFPFILLKNLTSLLIFLPCSLSLIIFVPAMEKWILNSSNSKWRYWKSDLKAAHYDNSKS